MASMKGASERRLVLQMLAIGRSSGVSAPGWRLRRFALALATALACCAIGVVVLTVAVQDAQEATAQVRAPRFTGEYPGEAAVAQWREAGDTIGGLQHTVVFVEPLTPAAPPPPGLPRWPEPGEVFLSPALVNAGWDEGITDRYGLDGGRIGNGGLVSPNERLAYVRPAEGRGEWDATTRISGFGDADPALFGDSLAGLRPGHFLSAAIGFLVVPAAVLVVIAARCGAGVRDRRTSVVTVLGASWWHRLWLNLGDAVRPVAWGAVLGVSLLLATAFDGVHLPLTDYRLAAHVTRSAYPQLLACAVVAALAVLFAVVTLHGRRTDGRRPGAPTAQRAKRRYVLLCALGLGLAMPVDLGPLAPNLRVSLGQYVLGMALCLATLPLVVSLVMTGTGRTLARVAGRRGWVGAVIAGRWLAAHPGTVARMVVALVVGVGLVTQIQLWTSRTTGRADQVRSTFAALEESVLLVRTGEVSAQEVKRFGNRIGPGSMLMALHRSPTAPTRITAGCDTLTRLTLPCRDSSLKLDASPDRRVRELLKWEAGPAGAEAGVGQPAEVLQRPVDSGESKLVVLSRPEDHSAGMRIREAAYRTLGMAPAVHVLGGAQLGGELQYDRVGDWVALLGLTGIAFLSLGAAISALSEFSVFAARLAPLAVLTRRTRVFHVTAVWYLAVPLGCAAVAALGVSAVLGYPMVTTGGADPSPEFFASSLLGGMLLAIVVGGIGGHGAARRAREWRPTAD